ncbi:MAG TPA: S8 family serine peptidase [Longimicrobium sp.]|nr:S8 family serine peptidase [Longimicrobium sp.]
MKRFTPFLLSGIIALAACADDPTALAPSSAVPSFSESEEGGTYLVRFKGNGVPAGFASDVAALGGEVIFAHEVGIAAVGGLSEAAAGQLAGSSTIAAVDADAYVELPSAAEASMEAAESEPASPAAPATALRYNRQWNLHTIQAKTAWDAGHKGNPSVKVGVLDSGVDWLHPDLVGRVDMALSRSFLSAAENARVTSTWGASTPLFADLHYHGTHVAATVASNAYIYAGVASNLTLVSLKVCAPGTPANGFQGSCPTSSVLNAILYAADNGIPVINMSLGGFFSRRAASAAGGFGPSFLATINQVFNYAHRKGTTVVVAAGNSAMDMDHNGNIYNSYCNAAHVICVSATGPTGAASLTGPWTNIDALAGYSNYGSSAVTVAGPGANAVAVSAACSGFTIVTSLLACRNRFFNSPTSWSAFSIGLNGTSMASPHVAGLAGLIVSDGTSQPSQVRARIQSSADDLGPAGTDPAYGKGRINVARAFGL